MKRIFERCIVAPLLACLLAGCGGGNEPASLDTPTAPKRESLAPSDEYLTFLMQKATELGEAELARLAATEMVYRNDVLRSMTRDPVFGKESAVYAKMYRSFHGFEVEDISRTDSLRLPIVFDIRFDYDLLSTPTRHEHLPGAALVAAKDRGFRIVERLELVQSYPCDDKGEVLTPDFHPLPRPDILTPEKDLLGPSSSNFTVQPRPTAPPAIMNVPAPAPFQNPAPRGK